MKIKWLSYPAVPIQGQLHVANQQKKKKKKKKKMILAIKSIAFRVNELKYSIPCK